MEAQASGTPLIATRQGALPEIIVEGQTGFVVDSIDDAIRATEKVGGISPRACRQNAESRFSDNVMAQGYARVYEQIAHTPTEPRASACASIGQ